jgi:hypothetical protein
MRIDKFALWTAAPLLPLRPSSTDRIVNALLNVARSLGPNALVPGKTAFALCAGLGGARDALLDAKAPDAQTTNAQLDTAKRSARVKRALAFLGANHRELGVTYDEQFRHLSGPGAFADEERRARLSELTATEQRLLREVAGDQAI